MIKHNAITDISVRIEGLFSRENGEQDNDDWYEWKNYMQNNIKTIVEGWLSENNIPFEKENQ